MGIITLTDRISVSVRAKNEAESNSQKRATGKNIANALTSGGSANISDSLADQLGNTSKPTIADEQGREWVAMSDIIAAGKKMKENGAFKEKKSYRYGNIECARIGDFPIVDIYDNSGRIIDAANVKYGPLFSYYNNTGNIFNQYAATRSDKPYAIEDVLNAKVAFLLYTVDNTLYFKTSLTSSTDGLMYTTNIIDDSTEFYSGYSRSLSFPAINPDNSSGTGGLNKSNIPINSVGNLLSLKQYGDLHEETSGGSLIDWDKPDDEIEEDIRRLHESWDVTEHPGASGSMGGTYILAGPIEYNDADPVG